MDDKRPEVITQSSWTRSLEGADEVCAFGKPNFSYLLFQRRMLRFVIPDERIVGGYRGKRKFDWRTADCSLREGCEILVWLLIP